MSNAAHSAYGTAKGYVQSAFVLMNSPDRFQAANDLTFFFSFHMLCGFAVELYLKAALYHRGYEERRIRYDFGHDLEALEAEVRTAGLTIGGVDFLLTLLTEHHKAFTYRYPQEASSYQSTDLNAIFIALSGLDFAVDCFIGASRSYGQAPGGAWVLPEERAHWRI